MSDATTTPPPATTPEEQALAKMFALTNEMHQALAPIAQQCDNDKVNPVIFAMALGQVHASFLVHMPGNIQRHFEHSLRSMATAIECMCKNDPSLPDDIKINILAVHNGEKK